MSEHTDNDPQSGKEIAALLCHMSQEKLLEVCTKLSGEYVVEVRAEMLLLLSRQQLFQFQQVPVGSASRLRGGNQAKRHLVFKLFLAVMTDSFFCVLRPRPLQGVCGRYRYEAGWCSGGLCS